MTAKPPPQAFISSYAPRLRQYGNPLLIPVVQPTLAVPASSSRITKRGTTAINYAEDGYDYDDDDDDEGRRRPTGLRSLRRDDPNVPRPEAAEKLGQELTAPVEIQGVWRDWMGKTSAAKAKPHLQTYTQAALPLTLIPIRIDLDIPAWIPAPPLPIPNGPVYPPIDPTLPVYRQQELTAPYRLKDVFLWNLHENMITTDQFAQCMVQDLDLPNKVQMAAEISKQIRTQLEEYAGVALHPLFHPQSQQPKINGSALTKAINALPISRDVSSTPAVNGAATPQQNGGSTPSKALTLIPAATASAAIPTDYDEHNPDDAYRCVVTLNINLSSYLYTDKFEWSLLHPPGAAEKFAKHTCADVGLAGEWVPAITHAIYEAVLRLKKEACESGGLIGSAGDLPNEAANGAEAGWRYEPEHLADEWEPKVEALSKEEIEKREGDRERQIRRLRRETARFSSTTNISTEQMVPQEEERMGRGERSKKKRRFRSLSPLGRSGTPGGRGTPMEGLQGFGGGGGGLSDYERSTWRCSHCRIWGSAIWTTRDGPMGPKTLCANCGFLHERDRKLPLWCKDLHKTDPRASDFR